MTKSRTLRKAGAVALSLAMAMSIVGVTPASAAAKKVTLSKAKGTIKVGKKATVKIKGTKKANIKKVTFKYTKKKIVKATWNKKTPLKFTVKGLQAGKTTVKAVVKLKKKVGSKKKYTLKYVATVKEAATPEETTTPTTEPTTTTEPTATPEAELAITAEQTGSSTFKLTANKEVGASDSIKVVRGTSIAQTIGTTVWNDAKTEATITLGSKIGDSEYTVTLTPADASKKAATCTFTGKTAVLKSIDFKGTNLVLTDSQMTKGSILIFGYNDFNEEISLSDISIYPSKGTATFSGKDNKITITGPTMGKDADGNDIFQPFTVGEKVNVNVVYQDNGVVLQKNGELTVAAQSAVKDITFGDLKSSDASLKDKKVTLSNMAGGTYYKEVTAVDQYGTKLTADDLKAMVWSSTNTNGTLYINPTTAGGQYVYFDGFDTAADKKTVIAKFKGGDIDLPGKGIISFNSVGGANVTTEIEVVDDPYIDTLTVSVPSDVYAGTEVELSVDAKDQDGNALDLYKYATRNQAYDHAYVFPEGINHTNKQSAGITCSAGKIKVVRNTTKKTVSFKYKYTTKGTETFPATAVLTVKSAKVDVKTVQVKVQKAGEIAGIQGLAAGTTTTFDSATPIALNLVQKLVFKDNYGGAVANNAANAESGENYPVIISSGADAVAGKKATATATGTNVLYGYTVKKPDGTFSTSNTLNAAGKYTVELYKYVGDDTDASDGFNDAAGDAITSLGKFEITLSKSNKNYKEGSFKATVKAGEELLYTGASSADKATIQVSAYDNDLKANVNVPQADGWTLTTSDTRFLIDNDIEIKADNGRGAGEKTREAETGKVTVDVWYGGETVASVDVNFSDADPEVKTWSWKVTTASNGVTADAPDEIAPTAGLIANLSDQKELKIGEGSTKEYSMKAVDQYGLPTVLTVTNNGEAVGNGDPIIGGTLRVQSGKLTKDVVIAGDAIASFLSNSDTSLHAVTATATAAAGAKTITLGGDAYVLDQYLKLVKNETIATGLAVTGANTGLTVTAKTDEDGKLVLEYSGAPSVTTTNPDKVTVLGTEYTISVS